MDTYLHLEGWVTASAVHIQILFSNKRNRLIRGLSTQNVAQGDVLESKILADIIVVRQVDTSWDSGGLEAQDFKRCEVWAKELVFFEIVTPRKLGDHALSIIHQLSEGSSALQVDLQESIYCWPRLLNGSCILAHTRATNPSHSPLTPWGSL